ncbi:hypothetical protein Sm713_72040 [Streptomyces sp. TS71-3]|nr:hypothetical protein Sm713_72040 [Streptomyces sp. TS71-3]
MVIRSDRALVWLTSRRRVTTGRAPDDARPPAPLRPLARGALPAVMLHFLRTRPGRRGTPLGPMPADRPPDRDISFHNKVSHLSIKVD